MEKWERFLQKKSSTKKWARPDLNRGPSPRQGDVITELDHEPKCISVVTDNTKL